MPSQQEKLLTVAYFPYIKLYCYFQIYCNTINNKEDLLLKKLLLFISLCLFNTLISSERTFYDDNGTRYTLVKSNGGKNINWLFLPGGPGGDSAYFLSLIDALELPGNTWLLDLPGNGSNVKHTDNKLSYDSWYDIFVPTISQFENPVLVGHSFGGLFPLLFEELETTLKGFVILNSIPYFDPEAAPKYAAEFDVPDLTDDMILFIQNPCQETFDKALDACMPYYFPKETLEKGRTLFSAITFRFEPAVWWQEKMRTKGYTAKWIPQKVPTLIVGAKYDLMCPYTLFKNDERFQRPNIEHLFIEKGGHAPWMEDMKSVQDAFNSFTKRLS